MNTPPLIKKALLPVFLASSLAVLSASTQANQNTNPPDIILDAAGLTVSAPTSVVSLYRLELRVARPDGKVQKIVTDGETINFSALDLPDGSYNYETWAMATNENGKYETGLSRGRFKVVSGQVYIKPVSRSAIPGDESMLQPLWQKMLTASLDFVIPSANAANLTASSTSPRITFDDTNAAASGSPNTWYMDGNESNFIIYDDTNDGSATNFSPVFKIEALGEYSGHAKIDTPNTKNSITIEDTGNLNFADGKMYFSKVFGLLGLGTITPDSGIHSKVSGKNQVFKLENTAQSTWTMGQSDNITSSPSTDGDFQINITDNGNGGPTGTQIAIRDENGNVGIGTANPTSLLHVKGAAPKLTVENTVASASQVLLDLKTNGIPAFRLTNTGNSSIWDFTQAPNKNFTLSKSGSGALEMQITPTGDVLAHGDVFARGVMLTSSRNAKTDIVPIKSADVMEKLKRVEIAEWRYKEAEKNDRHISPMAEDFYSLFKLGPDNKHINPNDLASVAIIAAKELQKKTDVVKSDTRVLKSQALAFESKTQKLELENTLLKKRLLALEKLVTNLASGEGRLSENGKKVALK